jgi:hypothetical protein
MCWHSSLNASYSDSAEAQAKYSTCSSPQTTTYTNANKDKSHKAANSVINIYIYDATVPSGPGLPACRRFTVTLRHTTVGTTSLDE